jgi:hypothetical protein
MKLSALLISGLISLYSTGLLAKDITRSYDFEDFDKLYLQGGGHYELAIGDEERIEVTADEEVFERFEAKQEGSAVYLGGRKSSLGFGWNSRRDGKVKGVIVVKSLQSIHASGSVHIDADSIYSDTLKLKISGSSHLKLNSLKAEELKLDGSGASHLNIDEVHVDTVKVSLSGSSHLNLKKTGEISYQEAHISGASHYNAEHVVSDTAKIRASGASNARVNATENIDARLSGASNLHYKGDAKVQFHTSGASNVRSI